MKKFFTRLAYAILIPAILLMSCALLSELGITLPKNDNGFVTTSANPQMAASSPTPAVNKNSASEQAEITAQFNENRDHIISMLKDLMSRKSYIAAVAWGERFANIDDAEFQRLYVEAKRLDAGQQAGMRAKLAAKEAYRNELQSINVEAEGLHAKRQCQNLVREGLKAPSSAKFPWDAEVQVTGTHEFFILNSYVDASNSFGAKVRTRYLCRLKYNGGGTEGWLVDELTIHDSQ